MASQLILLPLLILLFIHLSGSCRSAVPRVFLCEQDPFFSGQGRPMCKMQKAMPCAMWEGGRGDGGGTGDLLVSAHTRSYLSHTCVTPAQYLGSYKSHTWSYLLKPASYLVIPVQYCSYLPHTWSYLVIPVAYLPHTWSYMFIPCHTFSYLVIPGHTSLIPV